MPGLGVALAGLGSVPGGYTSGGLQWEQLRQAQLDRAGMQALGNALQAMQGPMRPMAPMAPLAPLAGAPMGPGGQPGGPMPPGAPGGVGAPMVLPGARPIGSVGPTVAGPAGPMVSGPATGGPAMRPSGPAAGPGAGPMGAPAPPQSAAPPSVPSAYNIREPMDWRQIVQMVVKANPNAPPEVIAAAVSKAQPLMSMDAQQQWRQIQTQLSTMRLEQAGERLDETRRYHDATEAGREDQRRISRERLDLQRSNIERLKSDSDSRIAYRAAESARRDAMSTTKQDKAARDAALAAWRAKYHEADSIMRRKIAASSLPPEEKKAYLKDLDAEYGAAQREMKDFESQFPVEPSSGPRGTPSPAANRRVREGFGATGDKTSGLPELTPDATATLQRQLQEHPDSREAIINAWREKWTVPEGL